MKILLILTTFLLLSAFTLILICKMLNPTANQNIDVPWDFPALAILSSAAYLIIENQEDIIHRLRNK